MRSTPECNGLGEDRLNDDDVNCAIDFRTMAGGQSRVGGTRTLEKDLHITTLFIGST